MNPATPDTGLPSTTKCVSANCAIASPVVESAAEAIRMTGSFISNRQMPVRASEGLTPAVGGAGVFVLQPVTAIAASATITACPTWSTRLFIEGDSSTRSAQNSVYFEPRSVAKRSDVKAGRPPTIAAVTTRLRSAYPGLTLQASWQTQSGGSEVPSTVSR